MFWERHFNFCNQINELSYCGVVSNYWILNWHLDKILNFEGWVELPLVIGFFRCDQNFNMMSPWGNGARKSKLRMLRSTTIVQWRRKIREDIVFCIQCIVEYFFYFFIFLLWLSLGNSEVMPLWEKNKIK